MSKSITITQEEILNTPNDFELGEKVRKMSFLSKEAELKRKPKEGIKKTRHASPIILNNEILTVKS